MSMGFRRCNAAISASAVNTYSLLSFSLQCIPHLIVHEKHLCMEDIILHVVVCISIFLVYCFYYHFAIESQKWVSGKFLIHFF